MQICSLNLQAWVRSAKTSVGGDGVISPLDRKLKFRIRRGLYREIASRETRTFFRNDSYPQPKGSGNAQLAEIAFAWKYTRFNITIHLLYSAYAYVNSKLIYRTVKEL